MIGFRPYSDNIKMIRKMQEAVRHYDSLGNPLEAVLSIPKNSSSVVILSHGFTSNKNSRLYTELESSLNGVGIGTVRYDYFGHGPAYGHTGYAVSNDTTLTKALESLRAVITLVKSKGKFNIGLLGSSFGGLLSLIIASQDQDIKALALKSSVTDPKQFWRGRLGRKKIEDWRRDGVIQVTQDIVDYNLRYNYWADLKKYKILDMAKNIKCPVLVIHGEKDTCVPINQSQELAKVLHIDVKVVKGADHSYSNPEQYKEIKQMIHDFFVRELAH